MPDRLAALEGVILGTAVGDALGLPREGLSPNRARALFGGAPLQHRFLPGWGMMSDDTEHTCLVAQALLRSGTDVVRFRQALGWGLRGWLLTVPAGIGKATLLACLKLCLGFPPTHSGVHSAGNGPAMRAALLGVFLGDDLPRLRCFVLACTVITHTDRRAELASRWIALAAHHGAQGLPPETFLAVARQEAADSADLLTLLDQIEQHLARQADVAEFAAALGLTRGVTGYILHTVPVVLYAWLRWPGEFRRAVEEVILLGGDADTTGAIIGALMGATLGPGQIPAEWLRLLEWPRSATWMRRLAGRLASPPPRRPLRLFWPALWPRNLFFFLIVLAHLVRRCLPPYWSR
ncbi:MAG: ADP-ribosylglycohydrolase family protein [Gemmataceae bacterium]